MQTISEKKVLILLIEGNKKNGVLFTEIYLSVMHTISIHTIINSYYKLQDIQYGSVDIKKIMSNLSILLNTSKITQFLIFMELNNLDFKQFSNVLKQLQFPLLSIALGAERLRIFSTRLLPFAHQRQDSLSHIFRIFKLFFKCGHFFFL